MRKSGAVPDAWDDDWVTNADSSTSVADPPPPDKKLSKAERRARQAEFNRQLWADAEAPKDSYFLHTRNDVPLKTDFKPAVKVLSRKPTPKAAGVADLTGLQQLNLEDDEDDDDNGSGKTVMTLEERQQKALLEREEKQKKYEEVRQRLFGSEGSSESQPGEISALPAQQNGAARGRSKSRGGRDTRPSPSAGNRSRQLFDPNSTAKPDSAYIQKKESLPIPGSSTPVVKQQIIRSPRNPPENTGTVSFGFMSREAT